ncbi:hypothetical protein HK104_009583 [Borealophlyctis nickersoniae]|nr:hypothetical protein HK104_009583 [Borealophlyctis nickersoniae]
MPAPKNPSHSGSSAKDPYNDEVPTLAVEREEPELIKGFDSEVQDEAQSGEHPKDFGTGINTGFSKMDPEEQRKVASKGGQARKK